MARSPALRAVTAKLTAASGLGNSNPETGAVVSKVRLYSPPYKPGDTMGDQRKGLISMSMTGTSIVEAGWNRNSFRTEHGRTNPYGKGGSYAVDFSSWNGKVINPKTGQVVLPP